MTAFARAGLPRPYRSINPIHALLLRLLGPADCWDSPLVGTKYDPYFRTLEHRARVQQRRIRAAQRRAGGRCSDE